MEFGFTPKVVVLVLSIYFVHSVVGMPRTIERRDEVIPLDQSIGAVILEKTTTELPVLNTKVPGRVPCKFEEATEESVCQEHCIPKGYSYGICVSYVCSCI